MGYLYPTFLLWIPEIILYTSLFLMHHGKYGKNLWWCAPMNTNLDVPFVIVSYTCDVIGSFEPWGAKIFHLSSFSCFSMWAYDERRRFSCASVSFFCTLTWEKYTIFLLANNPWISISCGLNYMLHNGVGCHSIQKFDDVKSWYFLVQWLRFLAPLGASKKYAYAPYIQLLEAFLREFIGLISIDIFWDVDMSHIRSHVVDAINRT